MSTSATSRDVANLLDDLSAIARTDFRATWAREVRAGRNGQRMDRPSTWLFDDLWSAACYQIRAEEAESLLADAVKFGAHPTALEALLGSVEREWRSAHLAALGQLQSRGTGVRVA